MRPIKRVLDLDNVDANGICETQSPAGAGSLVLNGAYASTTTEGMPRALVTVANLDVARQLSITSDGDDSGVTFTVTGKDGTGRTVTEVINGPSSTTVESVNYYKVVSDIVISAAATGDITVGFVDEAVLTIALDRGSTTAAAIAVNVTGTISFTVQETFEPIQDSDFSHVSSSRFLWSNITALTTKTADTVGAASVGASAVQLVINSYTDTAEIVINVSQTND